MDRPVALVTGVSRGIGLAIADALTAGGYHVVGLSRVCPEGFAGTFIPADLADEAATAEALSEATRRFKVLRLVNNAGIARMSELEQVSLEDFEALVAINLRAVVQGMQAVLPGMRTARFGRIVTIGSRAGLGKEGRALYGATKAAVVGLSRSAALEYARHGITVNVVAPGPIETDMIRQNYPSGSPARTDFERMIPAGRFGRTEEVAAAVAYFLSDAAGFTTGQTLYVCGGLGVGMSGI